MVGWVGGFYETWPTTNFWLLHAAFAAGSGFCLLLFRFIVSHHLEAEADEFASLVSATSSRSELLFVSPSCDIVWVNERRDVSIHAWPN